MKRLLFILFTAATLTACGSETSTEDVDYTTQTEISNHLDNHIVVAGETNLPDGTRIHIKIQGDGYNKTDILETEGGSYVSDVFTRPGDKGLKAGEYTVRVFTPAEDNRLDHEEILVIEGEGNE